MYCQKCGTQIPDNAESLCPNCGNDIVSKEVDSKTTSKRSNPKVIIPVIIAIAVVLLIIIGISGNSVVSDVKDIVFEQHGTISIGKAVDVYLEKAEWTSEELSDDEYAVTLKAFSKEIGTFFSVEFRVTYTEDMVYALPLSVEILDEKYTDDQSVWEIMAHIYGKNLEEATDSYWEAYWK